jgi:hypothetical protein
MFFFFFGSVRIWIGCPRARRPAANQIINLRKKETHTHAHLPYIIVVCCVCLLYYMQWRLLMFYIIIEYHGKDSRSCPPPPPPYSGACTLCRGIFISFKRSAFFLFLIIISRPRGVKEKGRDNGRDF